MDLPDVPEASSDIDQCLDQINAALQQAMRDRDNQGIRTLMAKRTKYAEAKKTGGSGPASDPLKWLQTLLNNPMVLQQTCTSRFDTFDVNKDGNLQLSELITLCVDLSTVLDIEPWSEDKIAELFHKFDTNKDQVLSRKEFKKFFSFVLDSRRIEVQANAEARANAVKLAERISLQFKTISGELFMEREVEGPWTIGRLLGEQGVLTLSQVGRSVDKIVDAIVSKDGKIMNTSILIRDSGLVTGDVLTVVLKDRPPAPVWDIGLPGHGCPNTR
eukprot:gnl/MRDRNA2_/MRDRNA2_85158_c0_seq1.p1 gnl/MRDRNA2_/MRDRNA2_85158_c0~~gnl/MRDRNA2_/MRDRNA2_85158_c0_seq1.p1  ORF type:complete len:273 (-),score=38.40 gnl/MRDRNA2_/MRDRNA2_85158_c0_seq1:468-1286(-)